MWIGYLNFVTRITDKFRVKLAYMSLLFFSLNVLADDCLLREQFTLPPAEDIIKVLNQGLCENAQVIHNKDELDQTIRTMLANQNLKLSQVKNDRHEVAAALNDCNPEKDSKALVINFAGTGAFNPRGFHVMNEFISCFGENKLDEKFNKKMFYSIAIEQRKMDPDHYKWSGIEAGPINQFFSDPYLKSQHQFLDFAVFASEEAEVYAGKDFELSDIVSHPKNPKGISMATACVDKYLSEAKKLSITPKIIVLTHSSGGRSAVKFSEKLKDKGVQLDLVFSMDPVKEAQKAIKEVAGKYLTGKKPVTVDGLKEEKLLYRPENTKRWVNVYQNVDTEGLKSKMKFGIHGSPIKGADTNLHVKDKMGSAAHGEIAYAKEVTDLFIEEMKKTLGN